MPAANVGMPHGDWIKLAKQADQQSEVANRARQESITTEIMEIVGGAEALSHR